MPVKSTCRAAALAALAILPFVARAQAPAGDLADLFGARPIASQMRLSPDGTRVAYVAPAHGPGTAVVMLPLAEGAKAHVIAMTDGRPQRLIDCDWISGDWLGCDDYGVVQSADFGAVAVNRVAAIGAGGQGIRLLTPEQQHNARGYEFYGGRIIDWLPDQDGIVLFERTYLPSDETGTLIGSSASGFGVERLDVRSGKSAPVESARPDGRFYMADGHGNIRIMGVWHHNGTGYDTGVIGFVYRPRGSRIWRPLIEFRPGDHSGFEPLLIDRTDDLVWGLMTHDGRRALYTMALDGSKTTKLVFSRPDVDVDDLMTIGARRRVIGASFSTDVRRSAYFDSEMAKLADQLHRALPGQPLISILGATPDERRLLIHAAADDDPGVYYMLDRDKHDLHILLAERPDLEGHALAKMKPVS